MSTSRQFTILGTRVTRKDEAGTIIGVELDGRLRIRWDSGRVGRHRPFALRRSAAVPTPEQLHCKVLVKDGQVVRQRL